jgi:uncharacterized protein YkwD
MKRVFFFCWVVCLAASTCVQAQETSRLSLDDARQYMLELINRDREKAGLRPVALDDIANAAAQKHAEEMASNVYLAHMNLAGKKPDQRYTEAGGVDAVGENTFLWWSGNPTQLPLQDPPTFARSDIEAIQGTYMAEVPPLDGHRQQILGRYHTHVGIGLGRATDGRAICLANTQEFVDRYLEVDAIPQTAKPGATIKVSGRAPRDKPLFGVAVGREELPAPKTRDETKAYQSYRRPEAILWQWAGQNFKVQPDGHFETTIELPKATSGLYYIMFWLRDDPNKTGTEGLFIASSRTVVVE